MKLSRFYLVTDSGLSRKGVVDDVREAVEAGCKIVQYREKGKPTREMIREAQELKKICAGKATFLINDRVDVALSVDADGVHLGQDDMPIGVARKLLGKEKIIGLTVHDVQESIDAKILGADYIGLSPIFSTSTKEDAGNACGVGMIKKVKEKINIPVVAIGGINSKNRDRVFSAGADSVVAISAVICADDVKEAVKGFL